MPLPYNTRDDILKKLLHDIREAQEGCLKLGHIENMQDADMNKLLARGWHGIAEMFDIMHKKVVEIAAKRVMN